jgi:MoxR-like ATPase
MLQKDLLQQDFCLVGADAWWRRQLVMAYAELIQRPIQVVSITSDLTESDLKQRRELSKAPNGRVELTFTNAPPVQAAIEGHLLLLDGLERASRNVLPTLNNLLEHRSMNLEDGRLLVSPDRYKELSHANDMLIPVHPEFRVIATTEVASSASLDPPLRSRFQMRRVDTTTDDILANYGDSEWLSTLVLALQGYAPFPLKQFPVTEALLHDYPSEDLYSIFIRSYPIIKKLDHQKTAAFKAAWQQVSGKPMTDQEQLSSYSVTSVQRTSEEMASVIFADDHSSVQFERAVPCGPKELQGIPTSSFYQTVGLQSLFAQMIQSHGRGRDLLLVSPPGQGKTALALFFSQKLGYDVYWMHLHAEQTDLFLRRATVRGETTWESTPLLQAIEAGGLVLLDGLEKLRPDVLASLQSLCAERDFFLSDGRRILPSDKDPGGRDDTQIIRVHPSFRIIALATHKENNSFTWLSGNLACMFHTFFLPTPTDDCLRAILNSAVPRRSPEVIEYLIKLRAIVSTSVARECGVEPLSVRKLIQILRRAKEPSDLLPVVNQVLVADLLPQTQRATLDTVLSHQVKLPTTKGKISSQNEQIITSANSVSIGTFTMERNCAVLQPELVPRPRFFDIPSHVSTIKDLLVDWSEGARAFLLLGSQGVGKNMLVDRLCELANWEREYIQLHRDSTIGQITLQPSVESGQIVWHDSPLVRAVIHGRSLVIDEADKAPIEVLAVLKSLVEDGELLLGDGRRISRSRKVDDSGTIRVHPNFTLWVLANRPGFPFMGNAFFRLIGDCFSTRVVANPDMTSEMKLLEYYGPRVNKKVITSLSSCFAALRSMSDQQILSYPYSAREAVAIVKHLNQFPGDSVSTAVHNVLDFDSFDDTTYRTLIGVFAQHGISMEDYGGTWKEMSLGYKDLAIEFTNRDKEGISSLPPDLSSPKVGKWDDDNEAHVGGNQWAGGTGGSDTAGLGGRGGPYRLDRGHTVHQVSAEAKAQVGKEAAKTARLMAQRELEQKLREINMDGNEWDMYQQFVTPIKNDIVILRAILSKAELTQPEKGWIRKQSHGEIDEMRLVDGVTGDKYIYKRRGYLQESGPTPKPKRLRFVVDVSGSMYRFNGYDSRLVRCLEATNLIMEAFDGMESRFHYSIVGHSGDSACIPLVNSGDPPSNEKQRMRVLQTMIAHSQYCQSGDNTLQAMEQAITFVSSQNSDDDSKSLVIGISDANLERYGIHPRQLGKVMETNDKTRAHCIFIASFGREADDIKNELPIGRGHVCMQTSDLPRIVKSVLLDEL